MKEVLSRAMETLPVTTLQQFKQRTERYASPTAATIDYQNPIHKEDAELLDVYVRLTALQRSQGKNTPVRPENPAQPVLVKVWEESAVPDIQPVMAKPLTEGAEPDIIDNGVSMDW